jgi:hypothetical protein
VESVLFLDGEAHQVLAQEAPQQLLEKVVHIEEQAGHLDLLCGLLQADPRSVKQQCDNGQGRLICCCLRLNARWARQ